MISIVELINYRAIVTNSSIRLFFSLCECRDKTNDSAFKTFQNDENRSFNNSSRSKQKTKKISLSCDAYQKFIISRSFVCEQEADWFNKTDRVNQCNRAYSIKAFALK